MNPTCRDCSKLFKDCACPWTETIKDHLLRTSGTEDQERTIRWSDRALARQVIEERIEYHLQRKDFQTAATILCIVDPPRSKSPTRRPARANSRVRSLPPPAVVSRRVRSSNSVSDTSAAWRGQQYHDPGRDGAVEATESSASDLDSAAPVAIPSARGTNFRKPRNTSLNMSFSEISFGGFNKLQRCHSESTASPAVKSGTSVNSRGVVSSSYSGGAHSVSTLASAAVPLAPIPSEEPAERAPMAMMMEEDSLVDPAKSERNEAVKRWYSQFLRRLGLDIKSVEVAKFIKDNRDEQEFRISVRDPYFEAGSASEHWTISDIARGANASGALRRWERCALCRLPVRGGLFAMCLYCGHGGHINHMREWHMKSVVCPTGCGCPCEEMRADSNHGEEQVSA